MQPLAILLGNLDAVEFLPSEKAIEWAAQSNVFWPIYIGLLLLTAAGAWSTYVKAGQRGWICMVPFYNLVVLLQIVRKHPLWLLAFFVPFVNILFASYLAIQLARIFGKGTGFGLGLIVLPFIFYPVLGFGAAKYRGSPAGAKSDLPSRGATAEELRIPDAA